MNEHVWLSDATRSPSLAKGFFADFEKGLSRQEEIDLTYHTMRQMFNGKLLPTKEMPKKFYYSIPEVFDEDLPGFFHTQYLFFKNDVADIFREFDLGSAYFLPVKLFQNDRATPIEQEVSVLCIGNTKDTVMIDETRRIKQKKHGIYNLPFMPKNNEVVALKSALEGPDVWIDPRIGQGIFFLSEPLANKLIKAGLKKKFALLQTKTI